MLFIFIVNTHELYLLKNKKGITTNNGFLKILDESGHNIRSDTLATRANSEDANQTKYGSIKVVNFTIDQWNHGWRIMI